MAVVDTRALWAPNAMLFGAGIGLAIGASMGGPVFIAPGIVAGAAVGLVIGAAVAAHRRPAGDLREPR